MRRPIFTVDCADCRSSISRSSIPCWFSINYKRKKTQKKTKKMLSGACGLCKKVRCAKMMCDVQNGVSALPRMSAAAAPRVPRERTPHAAPGRHLPTHGPNVGAREAGQGGRGEGGGAMGGLGGARSGAGSARRHAPRRARTPVTACWGNGGAHLLSTPSARHLAVHLGSGACDGLNPFPLSTPLPALLKRRLPPRPWGRLRTPSKAPAYCLEGAGCRPGRGQQTSRRALHGMGTAWARHGHGMGTAWALLGQCCCTAAVCARRGAGLGRYRW